MSKQVSARFSRIAIRSFLNASLGISLVGVALACHETKVGPGQAASVSLDSVASQSIVVGDSLRDTLGVPRPLQGTAYGDDGSPLPGFLLKYRVLDRGITLDSLTGYAIGDSVRSTGVRILVDAGGLQTTPVQLFVVPVPDTVVPGVTRDSILYSSIDTSAVLSPPMTIAVGHKSSATTGYDPVQAYIVSYALEDLADTTFASIVDGSGRLSIVDTTSSDGTAARYIRLHPLGLTTPTDSVAVLASVRYRGTLLSSPVRFVLKVRPNP